MKTPFSPPSDLATGWVDQMDDSTLRREHPRLDECRALDFARWLDEQLDRFEHRFRAYAIPRSVRQSLGR